MEASTRINRSVNAVNHIRKNELKRSNGSRITNLTLGRSYQDQCRPNIRGRDGEERRQGFPKETPKANLSLLFTRRIESIYTGQRSKPEDLFEPLAKRNMMQQVVGHVTDPVSREIFSLWRKVEEELSQVPSPRKPHQMEEWKAKRDRLQTQITLARHLFTEHVIASVRGIDLQKGEIAVCQSWEIVQGPELPDGMEMGGGLSSLFADLMRRQERE
jgi:hypothetical protein